MKTELFCEYCSSELNENDKKCPNCGADCSKVTYKYRKEKEQAEEQKKEEMTKDAKKVAKVVGTTILLQQILIPIIVIIIFAVVGIFMYKSFSKSGFFGNSSTTSVGYQKKAKTSKLTAKLLSYDFYEYTSVFDEYKTKDGYQKIAFEFEIENLYNFGEFVEISLKADGYNVSKSEINVDSAFATLKSGKGNYPKLNNYMEANEKQKGYIGFEVPIDKKELLFKVGDNINIKIDNPVYNSN